MNSFPRISLPVKAVRKALALVKPLMARFKPILATVQIERGPSGTWVCASDLEMTARIRVDGEWNRDTDRVNIEHKRITDVLKATKAENVRVGIDDDKVRVEAGAANVSMDPYPSDEYPAVPYFAACSWRCFGAEEFIKAVELISPYCDVESTRFALGSILLESPSADCTRWVATDGRRLAIHDVDNWGGRDHRLESARGMELDPVAKQSALLPLKLALLAKECAKAAPKNSRVDLAWSPESEGWSIRIEDFAEVTCRNVDGRFPHYQDVTALVEHSPEHTQFNVDASEFLEVVKAAQSTFDDDERSVALLAIPEGPGDAGLYIDAPGFSNRQRWTTVYGPMVDINLSAKYLRAALESILKVTGKTKSATVNFRIKSRSDIAVLTVGSRYWVYISPVFAEEKPEERKRPLSPGGQKLFNRLHGIAEPTPAVAPEPTPEPTPSVSGDRAACMLVNALAVRPVGSDRIVYAREHDAETHWWRAEPADGTCWWTFNGRQVLTYHAILEEVQAGTLEVCEVPPLACFHRAPVVAPAVVAEPEPETADDDEPYECPMLAQRRKDRETLRANPERYAERLRIVREAREASYSLRLTEIRDDIRETLRSLRAGRYFDRNDSERLEVLAQWRSVRRHWLNLPENRAQIEIQRQRSEIRHRDKLSLFGRQTPNERPYDGPAPIAPTVATPVKAKRVRTPKAAPTVSPRPEFSESTPRPGFSGVDVIAPTVRTVRRIGERRVYVRSWMGWFAHNPDADGIYVRDSSGPMTTLEVSVEVQAGTMEVSPDVPTMKPGRPTETVRENVPSIDPAALAAFATIVLFHPEPSELWTVSTVDVEFGRTLLTSAGRSTPEAKQAERARRFARSMSLSPIANRVRKLAPIGKPTAPRPGFSEAPRPEFSGLGIGIRGTVYGLEIIGDAFRLAGPNGTYDVSPCSDPVRANHGYRCDCPDHERRHAGNPTKGCKHVNALREVGLIPTTTNAPDRGPDGIPAASPDSGRKAKAAALRDARANLTGNTKPAWMMTAKEHATLSASLKVNSSGTGGDSAYGMGRSSSEQGFKAIADRAAELRTRLSGGTTVVRMGQLYAGDQRDAVRAAILNGEPVPSGRMRRLGINPDRPLVAPGRGTPCRLAKAEEIRARRADGSPDVPYTPAPEFSGVATVETLPPVCGGSGEDIVAIHPWQAKGLGMAPFRFRTTIEHPSKSLQEANPDAYNYAAGIAAQQRKALKVEDTHTCHACYRDITVAYVIESADGKRFVVGCECVLKTDDTHLITRVEAAKRERNRKANRKRAEVKRAEKAIVARADAELAAKVNAPIIEALERHPSGWAGQAVAELRRKPAAKCSSRFLDVVYRMCSEVTGEPAEHFHEMATAASV